MHAPMCVRVGELPMNEKMSRYKCKKCGYVYNPEKGEIGWLKMYKTEDGKKAEYWAGQAVPGTPFEKLPDDWECPDCEATKDLFEKLE